MRSARVFQHESGVGVDSTVSACTGTLDDAGAKTLARASTIMERSFINPATNYKLVAEWKKRDTKLYTAKIFLSRELKENLA
jgi:hypothetical protein